MNRDWRSVIQQIDRDWAKNSVRSVAYRFTGPQGKDREFIVVERPGQPYAWTTST